MKKLLLIITVFATSISFAQTGPATTWITTFPATIQMGTTYPVSASYNAGDNGSGTDYVIGSTNQFQYTIQLYTETSAGSGIFTKRVWKNGKTDTAQTGVHAGTSAINYLIPTTLTPTASLNPGEYYVLRVGYQNSNGAWSTNTGQEEIPITITAAPASDSVAFAPANPTFNTGSSIVVNYTYTSDKEVPINGLAMTYWTVIDAPFCDAWRGQALNTTVLPAGTNMPATMTLTNFPAAVTVGGNLMTTAEINTNQVNQAESDYPGAGSTHFWQLRLVDAIANDDFTLTGSVLTPMIIDAATAGTKDYEALKVGVYPNPTSDFISIENVDKDIKSVKIYDVTGKEVKAFNGHLNLNVSSLQPGLYLIKTDTGRLSKFIKQ